LEEEVQEIRLQLDKWRDWGLHFDAVIASLPKDYAKRFRKRPGTKNKSDDENVDFDSEKAWQDWLEHVRYEMRKLPMELQRRFPPPFPFEETPAELLKHFRREYLNSPIDGRRSLGGYHAAPPSLTWPYKLQKLAFKKAAERLSRLFRREITPAMVEYEWKGWSKSKNEIQT
jgi:hypothetical protein